MVFGPILDSVAARRRGVPMVQVLSEGNRLVALRLPWGAKLAFWLTNLPYWALAAALWSGSVSPAPLAGSATAHALSASVVACASTAFHGMVLFGPVDSAWPRRLLSADIFAANLYGLVLSLLCGLYRALRHFGLPLLLLMGAAKAKRAGHITTYACFHGTWHVFSCAAMWRCLQSLQLS